MPKDASSEPPAARLADHPALDLLNTEVMVDGKLVDSWQTDGDVARWLRNSEPPVAVPAASRRGLLTAGRQLRRLVRALVVARKQGLPLELEPLNAYLLDVPSALQLESDKGGQVQARRQRRFRGPKQAFAPLAEAAAELIASGNFQLIRKCESETCALWFYDRTKSHRRRWCSMAACGNRHKAAALRERARGSKNQAR